MNDKKFNLVFMIILLFLLLIPFACETGIGRKNQPELRHLEDTFGEATIQFSKTGSIILANVNSVEIDNFDFYLKNGSSFTKIESNELTVGATEKTSAFAANGSKYYLNKVYYTLNYTSDEIVMKLKNKINSLKGLFAYSDVFKVTLNFKTEEVTTMELMFMGCSSLTEVKFEEINTSKVVHLYRMFTSCSELTQLDLSGWEHNKRY